MNAKRYTHKIPTQAAFTLIELLAVIAVIGRSYGWNQHARFNFRGSDTWPRLNNVAYPSRSVLAGDTTSSSAIGATNNQVNFRNNGQAAFLFVDGHVELRGPDEVPNNANHVFWGGSILSEAEE